MATGCGVKDGSVSTSAATAAGTSSSSGGGGAATSNSEPDSASGASTPDLGGISSTGVNGTTGTTGESLTPAEQAAQLACAARGQTEATEIPAPMMGIGFEFSEFPARFLPDFGQAEQNVFEGDMWCHVFAPGCTGCGCPLYDCANWYDAEGEMRIYMVTRGIDYVEFYGSDEPLGDEPFAPLTQSVQYDVDETCPELPQVWLPSREENQWPRTNVVCMHHEDDLAEVVFVRLP